MDGVVVVVWALVALVVWALISVDGMVVGAVFWVAILDRVVGGRRWLWITSLWVLWYLTYIPFPLINITHLLYLFFLNNFVHIHLTSFIV